MVVFNDVRYVSTEEYFNKNEYAVDMFKSKYAYNIEDRKETPAEVFYRVASELAQFEDEDKKQHYTDNWFDLMYNGWFRPGGSIISSLGSGRKISTMNCTTIPIHGDSLEDISHAYYSLMKCAAYRQGMGVDLSVLRPRESKLNNAAEESTGIVPWAKKFSNVGNYVGQRGRLPALLISLSIEHPDIEEFIISKIKKGEIENANISVQITNNFMNNIKNEKKWKLVFNTHNETIEKETDPEYLIDLIADTASKSAEPGVQFIDLMRSGSMVNAIYEKTGDERFKIISTNACLPEDALISTNKGDIKIIDIVENPSDYKILTYNHQNKHLEYEKIVFADKTREQANLIELELEDGNVIELTPDHEVHTENRGYVQAAGLNEEDILYSIN